MSTHATLIDKNFNRVLSASNHDLTPVRSRSIRQQDQSSPTDAHSKRRSGAPCRRASVECAHRLASKPQRPFPLPPQAAIKGCAQGTSRVGRERRQLRRISLGGDAQDSGGPGKAGRRGEPAGGGARKPRPQRESPLRAQPPVAEFRNDSELDRRKAEPHPLGPGPNPPRRAITRQGGEEAGTRSPS